MDLLERLKKEKRIGIYGAQIYATSIYGAVQELCPETEIVCFLVTRSVGNPAEIDGVPVCEINSAPLYMKKLKILIATPEFYHEEIFQTLISAGFDNIEVITGTIQAQILDQFYSVCSLRKGWEFLCVQREDNQMGSPDGELLKRDVCRELISYQAHSAFDKPLSTDIDVPVWIYPVQAGSSLTDQQICTMRDDEGVHISEKNRNFCEMTVAYWVWKNRLAYSQYVGICHYRRFLDINPQLIMLWREQGVDAVLPYPMLVYPNAWNHHTRFVQDKDWDRMMAVLKEKYPEYYAAAGSIWSGREFYLHNIWILRADQAEKFLTWMFDVLLEIERRYEDYEDKREDRHMGYLGENLTTLYFMFHRKNMKILHASERILS